MDAATLATAMGCSLTVARTYVSDFNVALRHAGCTTVHRAAMFCAQLGHESVGLRYMQEIWGPTSAQLRYDPSSGSDLSRDLGNTVVGDGYRFRGRGPIQLTGRGNYRAFSQWAKSKGLVAASDYFVRNPDVVASSRWGFLAASWYWTVARPQINGLCDRADLVGVTRAINGGTNGLDNRRDRWNRCLELGARLLPSGGGSAPPAATQNRYLKEDTMIPLPADRVAVSFNIPPGTKRIAVNCPHKSMDVSALFLVDDGYPAGRAVDGVPNFDLEVDMVHREMKGNGPKRVDRLRRWVFDVDPDAVQGAIYYKYGVPGHVGSLDFIL